MHIVVIIICLIITLFIYASMQDNGIEPRSRSSLRYQRRKARRMGLDPADVSINTRSAPNLRPYAPSPISQVSKLASNLLYASIMLLGAFLIGLRFGGDWVWIWFGVMLVGAYPLDAWQKGKFRR